MGCTHKNRERARCYQRIPNNVAKIRQIFKQFNWPGGVLAQFE
jgi:hypothetical protein